MSSKRTNLLAIPVISQDATLLAALSKRKAVKKSVQRPKFSQHNKRIRLLQLVSKLALEPALNYLKLRVSQKTLVTLQTRTVPPGPYGRTYYIRTYTGHSGTYNSRHYFPAI